MTVLIAEDLHAVGGEPLRGRALASALAHYGGLQVIEVARVRREAGCANPCDGCLASTLEHYGSGAPDPYAPQRCARAVRLIAGRVAALAPQPVIVSHLRLHSYFTALSGAGIRGLAIDLHNIESDLHEELLGHPLAARMAVTTAETVRALRVVEASIMAQARIVCTTSAADAARVAARFPGAATRVVPNAVRLPDRAGDDSPQVPGGPHLLFLGALWYFPNLHAAMHLTQEIYPLARRLLPDCTLTIAGQRPPQMLMDFMRRSPARLIADPPDSGAVMRGRILVVPLRFGGGTRLKLLEAFAHGVPVVSTGKGIEGIDATPGAHFLQAESPEEFAGQLLRMRADRAADRDRCHAARDLVRRVYSWQAIRRDVAAVLAGLGDDPPPRRFCERPQQA